MIAEISRGTPAQPVSLNILPENFRPVGDEPDPWSRLLCTCWMLGATFHLEAIAVTKDAAGVQVAEGLEELDWFEELAMALGGDEAFHTSRINGRDYVLFMSPYRD